MHIFEESPLRQANKHPDTTFEMVMSTKRESITKQLIPCDSSNSSAEGDFKLSVRGNNLPRAEVLG